MQIRAPTPKRSEKADLESLISRLVDRPSSAALRDGGEASPRGRGSRPNSVLSGEQLSADHNEAYTPPVKTLLQSIATQTTLDFVDAAIPAPQTVPRTEVLTYSKAVQTDAWTARSEDGSDTEGERSRSTSRANIRLSRRDRERDEEIRELLRKEVEEELKANKESTAPADMQQKGQLRFPLRTLNNDELHAVTSSEDFLDFVERSSKVIERALDEEYDVLADYAMGGVGADDEEDEDYRAGKKRREIKQVAQFWDERWSKKRMITDISFSAKVSIYETLGPEQYVLTFGM